MPKRKYRGKEWWAEMRLHLAAEQQSRCPWCGGDLLTGDEVAVHHRQRRQGRDEDDDLGNLLLLHGPCHREVHANPALARERGAIVPTWADPLDVPKPS